MQTEEWDTITEPGRVKVETVATIRLRLENPTTRDLLADLLESGDYRVTLEGCEGSGDTLTVWDYSAPGQLYRSRHLPAVVLWSPADLIGPGGKDLPTAGLIRRKLEGSGVALCKPFHYADLAAAIDRAVRGERLT